MTRSKWLALLVTLVVIVGVGFGVYTLVNEDDPPPSRWVPLAPTSETPTPTGTFTPEPIEPPPVPYGCTEGGLNTSDWNTAPDDGSSVMTDGRISNIYQYGGQCFDTVVFDVATMGAVGHNALYVTKVNDSGCGADCPVDLDGNAFLQLTINAMPADHMIGYNFVAGTSYKQLREVKLVSAYEGYTTIGVGVEAKTPFAVEYMNSGFSAQVVLYVAHD